MSEEETLNCEQQIALNVNKNATVVFWNMMVERKFKTNSFIEIDSYNDFIKERPFFYQALRRYKKNEYN